MTNKIHITHPEINGGADTRIFASSFNIAGKKNTNQDPEENTDDIVEVQDLSVENLTFKINQVREESSINNSITYADVVKLLRERHVTGNECFLYIETKGKQFTGSNGQFPIKVVFKGFDLVSDAKDSDKFLWNMKFVETA